MPYHPEMAPPPLVVAVVGSEEPHTQDLHTAAWVAGRDVAWAGAWLAVNVGGAIAMSAVAGARDHDGVVLGLAHDGCLATPEDTNLSLVIRTGLPRPQLATVLAANADAMLAFPGDAQTMAEVAAALQRGVPTAQIGTTDWPVMPLTPTEVPAWLDELISRRARAAPADQVNPPDPPVLTHIPHRRTRDSASEAPARTPSSSSSASDATSSHSRTTPTSEPASTSGTPTA